MDVTPAAPVAVSTTTRTAATAFSPTEARDYKDQLNEWDDSQADRDVQGFSIRSKEQLDILRDRGAIVVALLDHLRFLSEERQLVGVRRQNQLAEFHKLMENELEVPNGLGSVHGWPGFGELTKRLGAVTAGETTDGAEVVQGDDVAGSVSTASGSKTAPLVPDLSMRSMSQQTTEVRGDAKLADPGPRDSAFYQVGHETDKQTGNPDEDGNTTDGMSQNYPYTAQSAMFHSAAVPSDTTAATSLASIGSGQQGAGDVDGKK